MITPPYTLIVPAHNEAAVIGRLLARVGGRVGASASASAAAVVVVANGCTDQTAAVARGFGVHVVETAVGSKSNALNLGDAAADEMKLPWPRFYVDADVTVLPEDLAAVAAVMAKENVPAAAPRMAVDLAGVPWGVRAFYRVWLALPYSRDGMIGSGVYGLSEAGRRRFGAFPKMTADDAYARLHFKRHERRTVQEATFTISPPRTLAALVAIKTRAHFGNIELRERFPELWKNEEGANAGGLKRLARNPAWWPAIAAYTWVRLASRRRARARWARGEYERWERDETSRGEGVAGC